MSRKVILKTLPLIALAGLLAGCGGGHHHGANANANANGAGNGAGVMSSANNASAMNTTNNTPAPAAGTVLVTVNGEPITAGEVNAYVMLRTHGQKIQLNDEQRYQIAKQLVQLTLANQAARKQNLAQKPDVRTGLALQKKFYLAHALVEQYMKTANVSNSKLKSEYQQMAAAQSGEEYKARHILVKKKATAEKIINKLNHGTDFAKLAKKYSTDKGSAKHGGELGWFKPKQMVPPFSAAVEKLKKGQYTKKPVKSKFGWHVILLQDKRKAAPPSYTASKPKLKRQARSTMLQDYFTKLRSQASIDWKVPNPASVAKPAVKQPATAPITGHAPAPAPRPATH
jgi:peptidyl-prolyl cis-trans isomerase C